METIKVDANVIKKDKVETHLDVQLEENINRLNIAGEEARNITDAIVLLK